MSGMSDKWSVLIMAALLFKAGVKIGHARV